MRLGLQRSDRAVHSRVLGDTALPSGMPRRSSKEPDPNVTAFNVVKIAVGDAPTTGQEAFAALIREIAGEIEAGESPEALAERLWPRVQDLVQAGGAAELGRRGGKKGGKARAVKLTKEQLSEIGRRGAEGRWGARKPPSQPEQ